MRDAAVTSVIWIEKCRRCFMSLADCLLEMRRKRTFCATCYLLSVITPASINPTFDGAFTRWRQRSTQPRRGACSAVSFAFGKNGAACGATDSKQFESASRSSHLRLPELSSESGSRNENNICRFNKKKALQGNAYQNFYILFSIFSFNSPAHSITPHSLSQHIGVLHA